MGKYAAQERKIPKDTSGRIIGSDWIKKGQESMTSEEIIKLQTTAKEMRRDIVNMCYRCGRQNAHLGGCMSMVELLAVLYTKIMHFDREHWEDRDRFILSKGHGGIAMYAALRQAGILSKEDISKEMRGEDTITFRHPKQKQDKGIEISTGSLGLGISYGIGLVCAFRRRQNDTSKVYVYIGDGECDEGSVWEGAALAGHMNLQNLVVIIDKNGLQLDGYTRQILNMENMRQRWEAFGFHAVEIDGHDVAAVYEALNCKTNKPLAIIADTVKGKGISFAEDRVEWHDNYVSDELYVKAMNELA